MTIESDDQRPKLSNIIVSIGAGAGLVALLLLAASGAGHRIGLWPFRTGFTLLGWAAWLGLGAAGVSLLGAVLVGKVRPRGRLGLALGGVIIGLAVAAVPWQWQQAVAKYPFIHDITTDAADPPLFVTLLAARANAPNTSDYGGPKVALLQHAAYPDIVPVILPVPVDEAFRRAEAAGRRLGWDMVALVAAEGRIEATDTTLWFGFTDDIVVRVRPVEGETDGARIDVRSVSRVGRSDVGANARRIRAFLQQLQD